MFNMYMKWNFIFVLRNRECTNCELQIFFVSQLNEIRSLEKRAALFYEEKTCKQKNL